MANAIISYVTPAAAATGVALNTGITVKFSTTAFTGKGVIELREGGSTGKLIESFDVVGSSRLSMSTASSVTTLTIDPSMSLMAGQSYKLVIPYGAYVNTYPYLFTTGTGTAYTTTFTATAIDASPPTTLPNNPSTIAIGNNFVINFDEAVKKGTSGTITLFQSSPTLQIETFSVSSPQVTVSGNSISIDPTAVLKGNNSYYIRFDAGAITDLAGNSFAGQVGFTTTNNASPVLDASKSPAFNAINEDMAAPLAGSTAGATQVSSLIGGSTTTIANFSDDNGNTAGLVVLGADPSVTIYYSTNSGASWTRTTNLSATNALAMSSASTNWLYAAGAPDQFGALSNALTIKAWDGTGGYTAGALVDTTTLLGTPNNRALGWNYANSLSFMGSVASYGVAVSGNYAYLASGDYGLVVVDVSNPSQPNFVSQVSPRDGSWLGYSEKLAVNGNYAYVTDRFFGMVIVDISNPQSPSVASRLFSSGVTWCRDLALTGNLALLAGGESNTTGLRIVDVSNPLAPVIKSTLAFPSGYGLYDVAVKGNYAYMASGGAGLAVVDISNPVLPVLRSTTNTPGDASSVAISGNTLVLADRYLGGIRLYDISNPVTPKLLSVVSDTTYKYFDEVFLDGTVAYAIDKTNKIISIVDISTASAPVKLNTISQVSWDGTVSNGKLLIASPLSFSIYSDGNDSPFSLASDTLNLSINPVNDPPSLSGVPVTSTAAQAGQKINLGFLSVADPDGTAAPLTLTLTPTAGTLTNITDANTSLPGVQITGTQSAINTALAAGIFTPSSAGSASLDLSLTDGIASAINASLNYIVSAAPALTATITSPLSSKQAATSDIAFTVTFNASDITDLTASDFIVTNGSVKSLSATSSTSTGTGTSNYTLTVTPSTNQYGAVTVALPAGAANANGNGNEAAKSLPQPFIKWVPSPPLDIALPYGTLVPGAGFSLENRVDYNSKYYYAAYNANGNSLVASYAAPTSTNIGGYALTMPNQSELYNVLYNKMPVGANSSWSAGSKWSGGTYYWVSSYGSAMFLSSSSWNPSYVFGSGATVSGSQRGDAMLIYEVKVGAGVAAIADIAAINEQSDKTATLTFMRTGSTVSAITVPISFSDSTLIGKRITLSGDVLTGAGTASVNFSVGASAAVVKITAMDNGVLDKSSTPITITLGGGNYLLANSSLSLNLLESGPVGSITISGTAMEGFTLTATPNFTDLEGLGDFRYQWMLDGAPIPNATSSTLSIPSNWVGKSLTVQVSYTDGAGTAEQMLSSAAMILSANKPVTGSVYLSGDAVQGSTMTAEPNLSDANGMGPLSYKWFANGVEIAGAGSSTLVLGQAQVGKKIVARVSFVDGGNNPEQIDSIATGVVANTNDTPVGDVIITGAAIEGQVLSVTNTLVDADGIPISGTGALTYQWKVNGSTIAGATASNYTLTQSDAGKTITVTASYTDNYSTAESVTSAATAAVVALDTTPPALTLSSSKTTLKAGESTSLTFTLSETSSDFIASDVSVSGGTLSNFSGTGTSYTATFTLGTSASTGQISVASSKFSDAAGNFNTDGGESNNTALITRSNSSPTGSVTITGLATQGQVLSATNTLVDADGIPISGTGALTYQWKANGSTIAGATASNYTLTQSDAGKTITVTASYTDNYSTAESVTSAATAAVVALDTTPPSLALSSSKTTLKAGESTALTFTLSETSSDFIASDVSVSGGTLSNFSGTGTSYTATFTLGTSASSGQISVASSKFSDAAGNFNTDGGESNNTALITRSNSSPTGFVTITGAAIEGQVLSATNTLVDADGIPVGALTYQWKANGSAISGATASSYTLVPSDSGKTITVTASYTDTMGSPEWATSAATSVVASSGSIPNLQGMIYHWKSHFLLNNTQVQIQDTKALDATPTDAFDLRSVSLDASTGKLTVEVWANPGAEMANFDFKVTTDSASAINFTSALPTDWAILFNPESPSSSLFSGFSLTSITTSTKLGTLELTLPVTSNSVNVRFSDVSLGGQTHSDQSINLASQTTGIDGKYSFWSINSAANTLGVSRPTLDGANAITSADALAALRIAVGLNPNPDPDGTGPLTAPRISPYQIIAADANKNGNVSSADALAILRMAVKLSTAVAQEWLFVDEKTTFWDGSAFTISRANVNWDSSKVINANLPMGSVTNLVGVLKGDVNGSWTAPIGGVDLDVQSPGYFQSLASLMGVPTDLWGGA